MAYKFNAAVINKNLNYNNNAFLAVKMPRKQKKALKKGLQVISKLGRNPYPGDMGEGFYTIADMLMEGVRTLYYVKSTYGCRVPKGSEKQILLHAVKMMGRTHQSVYGWRNGRQGTKNWALEMLAEIC